MCKVERKDVLRGLTLEEIEAIEKILRAKGYQEIKYALNSNNVEVNHSPLNLYNSAIYKKMIMNNKPIFINDATIEQYRLLGKCEAPYQLQLTPQNSLVLFDNKLRPI